MTDNNKSMSMLVAGYRRLAKTLNEKNPALTTAASIQSEAVRQFPALATDVTFIKMFSSACVLELTEQALSKLKDEKSAQDKDSGTLQTGENMTSEHDKRTCIFCKEFDPSSDHRECKALTSGQSYVDPELKIPTVLRDGIQQAQNMGMLTMLHAGLMMLWRPFIDKKNPTEMRFAFRLTCGTWAATLKGQELFDAMKDDYLWALGIQQGYCVAKKQILPFDKPDRSEKSKEPAVADG